jgi:hypothetical protein
MLFSIANASAYLMVVQGSRILAGFTGGAPANLKKAWTPGSTGAQGALQSKLAHCNGYC